MSASCRSKDSGTIVPPIRSLVVNTLANTESRKDSGSDEDIHLTLTFSGVITNTGGVVTITLTTVSVVVYISGTSADPLIVSTSRTSVVVSVVGVLGAVGGLSSSTLTVRSSPGTFNDAVT